MRTIYAIEVTLYKITVEPNPHMGEGERIIEKRSLMSHYDGSRSEASAEAAYYAADAALKATK